MAYFSLHVMWSMNEKANRHSGMVISASCPDDVNGISHMGTSGFSFKIKPITTVHSFRDAGM